MNDGAITALLERWKAGDRGAESRLIDAVYPVLRELARAQVRRNSGVLTLQATELANEAYTRLARQQTVDWQNREHFYAIAATVIRRVVVDYLRQRGSEKRGQGLSFIPLDALVTDQQPTIDDSIDWLALDQALGDLEKIDAACARMVELRFFSGLNNDEIAEVCGSSTATVGRQWRFARVFLAQRLGVAADGGTPP